MFTKFALFGSVTSALTFLAPLLVAMVFLFIKRRKKTKLRTVLRVLFAPKIWLSPSVLLDFKYVIAASFVFSGIFSYLAFADMEISDLVYVRLGAIFGTRNQVAYSGPYYIAITTLVLYIAYEFAYWLDHYLSHKIPFLWEFHKVHHSAKVLTPFTNYRVHPVDTLVFLNIVAVILGGANGVIHYAYGQEISLAAAAGINLILLSYMALYGHLQHSELWIPFTGLAGKIFLSPAHHQIHHSTNQRHFDKNFGGALVIFDWLFGTLYMPSKDDERVAFGIADHPHLEHLTTSIFYPFVDSAKHIFKGVRIKI